MPVTTLSRTTLIASPRRNLPQTINPSLAIVSFSFSSRILFSAYCLSLYHLLSLYSTNQRKFLLDTPYYLTLPPVLVYISFSSTYFYSLRISKYLYFLLLELLHPTLTTKTKTQPN
ncbi:hypothetical protein B0H16DRAFT_1549537 [Mycena metata]|uniref:Uncharacterized protein n=1 Tax=Mycena metata TaxID=1033252 RepID=A0AAD7IW30_9AGAR|nr:hypothetical protein B0H16DRAFT_1549537 [Mycena metata]